MFSFETVKLFSLSSAEEVLLNVRFSHQRNSTDENKDVIFQTTSVFLLNLSEKRLENIFSEVISITNRWVGVVKKEK